MSSSYSTWEMTETNGANRPESPVLTHSRVFHFSLEKCGQSKGNHCTSSKTKTHRCQLAEGTHSDCSRNLGGGGMLHGTGCICMDMELPCAHVYTFKAEVTNNIILTY